MTRLMVSRITAPLVLSLICAVISLALFAKLAEEMLEGDTRHFDTVVRDFAHSHSSGRLTSAMRFITFLGSPVFVSITAASICIALWVSRRRQDALFVAITVIGGSLLMWILKLSFHRPRPPPFFDTRLPTSYSFPSGHALLSFCLCGAGAALLSAGRKSRWFRALVWTAAGILVVMIGYSRIYLGVHYPSDVIAGYLGALVWLIGVGIAYRKAQ